MRLSRHSGCRARNPKVSSVLSSAYRATGLRVSVGRELDVANALRTTVLRARDARGIAPRESAGRETVPRAEGSRTPEAARTDLPEKAVIRAAATGSPRITAAAITEATETARAAAVAEIRAAREERIADSSSQEEEAARMEDHRETGRMDFREAAGLALAVAWAIAAVRGLVRGVTVTLTVVRATVAALEDREPDSEIISLARALLEKLRARISKRNAKKKRGGPTARRRASAPRRTISTKRTKR